jgi:hypothetical protein
MQNELIFWRKAIQICQMLCNNQESYRSIRDRINDRENRNPAMLWRAWNEKPLASTITTTGSLNSIAAVTVCCKHACVQSSSAHSECTDELKDPDHVQMLWGWLVVMNPHIYMPTLASCKGSGRQMPKRCNKMTSKSGLWKALLQPWSHGACCSLLLHASKMKTETWSESLMASKVVRWKREHAEEQTSHTIST